jgi:chromate reductase, NAD(P)H dehydrogenase (quinone)
MSATSLSPDRIPTGVYNVDPDHTALLRAAAELALRGVELTLYEGLERLLPPYNEDRDTDRPPAEVARLRREIASADAVLFSNPEYNGTMPGQIKQAVDWASRPHGAESALWGETVAVVGASVTDYGGRWAQDHLRKSLGLAGARVLSEELPVARAPELFGSDGDLADPETRDRARRDRRRPCAAPPSVRAGGVRFDRRGDRD